MKLQIIIFIFFISLKIIAQPGDYGYSEKRFKELTEKLKADPNNYELIWERIKISRFNDTYFDIYKKSGNFNAELSYFKNSTELFEDLNKLINNNYVIDNHNIAEFTLLRGRLYYFTGETKKALEDYLLALSYNSSHNNSELNDEIYISIASYYYNLEEILTVENANLTLKYINMLNPNGCNSNQRIDCYEREKKELLRLLKEEKKLIEYYKELITAEHNSYLIAKNDSPGTTDYIFNKNELYFRTLKRINEFAEYYDEMGYHHKSKYLTEQLIKFIPPKNNGKHYTAFPKEKILVIANDEYNKRFFKLHNNKNYESTWDYPDLTEFIVSIKN